MTRAKPVQTETCLIKWKAWVTWPDADVDAVYNELGAMFSEDHVVQSRTPTRASVSLMLDRMFDDPVLKEHGIDVDEAGELMMGCCQVQFEVEADRINELPELIKISEERLRYNRKKYVRYYKKDKVVRRQITQIVTRG